MIETLTNIPYFLDSLWMLEYPPSRTPISNFLCPTSWLEKRIENILAKNIRAIESQQLELDNQALKYKEINLNIDIAFKDLPEQENSFVCVGPVGYIFTDDKANALQNVSLQLNDREYVFKKYETQTLEEVKVGISSGTSTDQSNVVLTKTVEVLFNEKKHTFKFLGIIEDSEKEFFSDTMIEDWKNAVLSNNPQKITNKGIVDSINCYFLKKVKNIRDVAFAIILDDTLWCVNKGRTRVILYNDKKVTQCTLNGASFCISRYSLQSKIENNACLLIIGSHNVFGKCDFRYGSFESSGIGKIAANLHNQGYSPLEISAILVSIPSPWCMQKGNTVVFADV